MAKQWFETCYRRSLTDMHIESWNEEFLSKFDAVKFFNNLKKARIAGPMIYTHSHVGWCNWPSKSGAMHPAWKSENKIGQVFELCNKEGMDVIAYYSLIYNNWVYENRPSWRMIGLDGEPSRGEFAGRGKKESMLGGHGRYGLICPNNEDYRAFLKEQFAELVTEYQFKGIFLDMAFWPMICYCPSCCARFKKETGKDIPEIVDWTNGDWLQFQDARERWMSDFTAYTTGELKKLRPELSIEHQYSIATFAWTFGIRSSASDASDYVGGDLYGGFDQQSFCCKLYYGMTANQPFEYMTSRCDPSLNDHTTTKSLEMMKLHAYLTYAHHGAFLVIDAIDPRGTLNENVYEMIGKVFEETMKYEPFYTGELTADIGLYFSFASKYDLRNNEPVRALIVGGEKYQHIDCILGAAKALRNAAIPYRVITDKALKRLSENKVIVLSDLTALSKEEEDALAAYVEQGGSLYISGVTPGRLVKRLLGIDLKGLTKEKITYMRPTLEGQKFFGAYTKEYPMTIFNKQMQAENTGSNTVLAELTLPYTDPADSHRFASIHSNPPGIDASTPAVVYGEFGKGKIIWSASPFEESNQRVHKQVFTNLLTFLNSEKPLIKTGAPAQAEFTVFTDSEKNIIQLHCINIQDLSPMIYLPGFTVSVRSPLAPKSVIRLPGRDPIAFAYKDGYTEFQVDSLDIFRMYQLDF
ncbi:MAG: alpha-L-fucosidase [Treponema sp.]|nr:alpha-L-fucosidase [Treponema sp.]